MNAAELLLVLKQQNEANRNLNDTIAQSVKILAETNRILAIIRRGETTDMLVRFQRGEFQRSPLSMLWRAATLAGSDFEDGS